MLRQYSKEEFYQYWQLNYLVEPGDKLHLASPMAFPPDSPVLRSWLDTIGAWALIRRRVPYEESFKELTKAIRAHGLEGAIASKDEASPINPMEGQRPTLAVSAHRYDRNIIFSAMAVNNFWQTSKGLDLDDANRGAARAPEVGSIWDEILKEALPPPSRRLRRKISVHDVGAVHDDGAAHDAMVFPLEKACPRELATAAYDKAPSGQTPGGGCVPNNDAGGGCVPNNDAEVFLVEQACPRELTAAVHVKTPRGVRNIGTATYVRSYARA